MLRADMKGKWRARDDHLSNKADDRFMWQCYTGAQNEGKGCTHWSLMDIEREGRGPVIATQAGNDVK